MIYSVKKYRDNFHLHLDRMASGEILRGSVPVGVKEVDDVLVPLAPTDLGVVLANSGHGKCLGKGTKVIMFDGSLKNVEDIVIGDQLMGVDSTARNVLALGRGREQMYWIRQNRATHYRVNESHILSLKGGGTSKKHKGKILNISVKDVINHAESTFLSRWKGYKVGVEFSHQEISLDPYFLGVWLGDGNAACPRITNMDEEILQFVSEYADRIGKKSHVYDDKRSKSVDISISNHDGDKTDTVKRSLGDLNVLSNKHIPNVYKHNSSSVRLQLLAGIVDTDGSLEHNGYRIVQKRYDLITDIKYIADSLGFRTTMRTKYVQINEGDTRPYYELGIYGDIAKIPVKVERRKCKRISQRVDASLTGIVIEKDIVDDYYGFTIDGDSLFLLEDFTVTHNTAYMMNMIMNGARIYQNSPDEYCPPIWITRETAIEELLLRLFSSFTGTNIKELKDNSPWLNWKDLHERADAMMEEFPIVFIGHSIYADDNRRLLDAIKAVDAVRKVHDSAGKPSALVAIDYLQRFSLGEGNNDKRNETSKIVDAFKDMALDEKIPVLLGSQAKREVLDRPYPVPMATDGMESANIEQSADWMLSLFRPIKVWDEGSIIPKSKTNQIVTKDLFYINVLKQRSGETNIGVYCSFDMRIFTLSSLDMEA